MHLQIGVRAPDFSDPLGMLLAFHRRVESRLRSLAFATKHLLGAEPSLREQALGALDEFLAYVSGPWEDHVCDEERSLFPRLRERVGEDTPLARVLGLLEEEHRQAKALHGAIALLGHRARTDRALSEHDVRQLGQLASSLEALCAGHLQTEDDVLARAREVLTAGDRSELGTEMLVRRQQAGPTIPPFDAAVGEPAD